MQSTIYKREDIESNAKKSDAPMHGSLCICSPEFEKISINHRDLNFARNVAIYMVDKEN